MENALEKDIALNADIVGYARISVDIEKEEDKNVSIENQIDFIEDYAKAHFPNCSLKIYKDRDRSGYSFEQREDYQKMRKRLMNGEAKIQGLQEETAWDFTNWSCCAMPGCG